MRFGQTTGVTFQAIDSFVSENMRGKGIFTKLAWAYEEYATQLGADLFWGFPNINAAPAWFHKLDWQNHGQVPFLIKPLRAGFFCRKFGLSIDFPLSFAKDQNLRPITSIGNWGDYLWEFVSGNIKVGRVRDKEYLNHRLFNCPQSDRYRVVTNADINRPVILASRQEEKHGGKIAYLMEALGGSDLEEILMSELGYLRLMGAELVLAWAFPWSPNYKILRRAGFLPLPARFRPINIWLGSKSKTEHAKSSEKKENWYLSYLDSDTV